MSDLNTDTQELLNYIPNAQDTAILYTEPETIIETPSAILADGSFEKEEFFPKHSHDKGYFSLLLNGSHSEFNNGKESTHDIPGAVWWNRPGVTHKSSVGEKGIHFFCVTIKPENLEILNQKLEIPEFLSVRGSQINWLALRIYQEFRDWQDGSELIAEGLTLEMLGHSIRKETALEKSYPKWLKQVIERLNDDFLENPSTEELAIQANVHPVYLARVFRKFYNQTVGEYVLELKVKYASKLLVEKKIPLVEVAFESGFSDQSHFTRIFKRFTGITPAVFRKTLL